MRPLQGTRVTHQPSRRKAPRDSCLTSRERKWNGVASDEEFTVTRPWKPKLKILRGSRAERIQGVRNPNEVILSVRSTRSRLSSRTFEEWMEMTCASRRHGTSARVTWRQTQAKVFLFFFALQHTARYFMRGTAARKNQVFVGVCAV